MGNIGLIAAITVREGIRNKALQGILAIAVLLCLVFLAIIPLFAFDTGKVAVDLGFASITLSGLAIVIFLGIALLTRDIHQRSVCMILARPVSRLAYVLGKFGGLALTALLAVLAIAGVSIITTWLGISFFPEMVAPRNFSWGLLATVFLFQYFSLVLLLAIAFLFTALTTNEYLSMLFTACTYIIGHSLETLVKVLAGGEPGQVSGTYLSALKIITWIFPNLSAFDLKVYAAYGLPLPIGQILWTLVYGTVYVGIVLTLTVGVFARKDIA